jgi:hypothetical protein
MGTPHYMRPYMGARRGNVYIVKKAQNNTACFSDFKII